MSDRLPSSCYSSKTLLRKNLMPLESTIMSTIIVLSRLVDT